MINHRDLEVPILRQIKHVVYKQQHCSLVVRIPSTDSTVHWYVDSKLICGLFDIDPYTWLNMYVYTYISILYIYNIIYPSAITHGNGKSPIYRCFFYQNLHFGSFWGISHCHVGHAKPLSGTVSHCLYLYFMFFILPIFWMQFLKLVLKSVWHQWIAAV